LRVASITFIKKSLVFSALSVLGIFAGGCTTSIADPYFADIDKDVLDEASTVPGVRQVTFTDWGERAESLAPSSHRTKTRRDPCAESNSYKLYGGAIRWMDLPATYRFEDVPNEDWKAAVRRAFATWNAASPIPIFQEDESATNIIKWISLDGPGRALAQTAFRYSGRHMLRFEIRFDASESWAILGNEACPTVSGSAFDVENVAVHEIGHALGLSHVTRRQDIALTMYPSAAIGETLKRSLGAGDRAGLVYLYGTR